jgi:hypothetical protein
MRLSTFLEYAAIVVGAIGILAGRHFALANGVHLGILLIGAGIAAGGIESLYSRQMSLRFSEAAGYDGFPAIVWGMLLLLAGGALIAYAYLLDTGDWPRAARLLKQYPGIVYVAASLLLLGLSVLLFADPGAQRNRWQTLLLRVPRVIVALVALVCGIAAMASGAWQFADPQGYAQVERQARARLDAAFKGVKGE